VAHMIETAGLVGDVARHLRRIGVLEIVRDAVAPELVLHHVDHFGAEFGVTQIAPIDGFENAPHLACGRSSDPERLQLGALIAFCWPADWSNAGGDGEPEAA